MDVEIREKKTELRSLPSWSLQRQTDSTKYVSETAIITSVMSES